MNHEKLFLSLNSQLENLNELLTVVNFQQKSLVNNNVVNLGEAVKTEEVLFTRINNLQKLIISEIIEISVTERLGLKEFRLSSLIKAFSEDQNIEFKKLLSAQKQIVRFVKEINRINFQNSFLIDHSRELIRNIITSAANLSRAPGQSKNVILDRRA